MTLEEYQRRKLFRRQFEKLEQQEAKLLQPDTQGPAKALLKKASGLVPEEAAEVFGRTYENTYRKAFVAAFEKAFQMLFEKGSGLIGKTCGEAGKRAVFEEISGGKALTRRELSRLDWQARAGTLLNTGLSTTEGAALGVFGISLPDIPVQIAFVLKTIYEISMSYGFDFHQEDEKVYQLLIIAAAVGEQGMRERCIPMLDQIEKQLDGAGDADERFVLTQDRAVDLASEALSSAMVKAKFVQGIPVVGVVGGLSNGQILTQISRLAKVKYKKRFLLLSAKSAGLPQF